MAFLFFKGIIQVHLLQISLVDNKKQISSLNFLINYKSTRSAPHILSLNDKYTFCISDFLIIAFVIL